LRAVRTLPVLVLVTASASLGLGAAPAFAAGGISTALGVVYASFQGGNGFLYNYDSATNGFTGIKLGQSLTSSPAETGLPDGNAEIAFQANTGILWYTPPQSGAGIDTENSVVAGSNPVVAGLADNGFEIAFSDPAGAIELLGEGGGSVQDVTGLGASGSSSPSITASANDGWQVAWNGANGHLWLITSNDVGVDAGIDTGISVESGTSPGIAALSAGGDIVAFENPEQELALYDTATGVATTTPYVLRTGTSPAVAASAYGGWQAAIVGTDGRLDLIDSATGEIETGSPVYAGVSPTITALHAADAYEAAYEDPSSNLGLTGTAGDYTTTYGMKPATHPTITLIP
jgi:hypothetical protein